MFVNFGLHAANGDRIAVNIPDQDQLLVSISKRFQSRSGFAVATLNLDHIVRIGRNSEFRQAYHNQDFVVADGNPIVWLSRLAGRPVSLVPGADLIEPLVQMAARQNVSVALLGSTSESLDRAAAELRVRVPELEIACRIAPPYGFDPKGRNATEVIEELRESGAGLTLLALGAEKQEIFAARGRQELPEMGFASIGAGLDFLAHHQKRAPRWMRRMALEWLWRMATNPRRLARRYILCAAHFPRLVGQALRQRMSSATKGFDRINQRSSEALFDHPEHLR